MFLVGDKVVHPLHGAGVIEDITQERLAGKTKRYYVFRVPNGSLTLKIPTENSGMVGLRDPMTSEQVEDLLSEIPDMDAEMTSNWNRRYRENMEKLKSGDIRDLAAVIKGLFLRDVKQGLSTGERKMLYNAKQVLLSEVALVKEITYDAAEKLLHSAILGGAAAEK